MKELIMSWMEDDESKFIFKNRVAYNESGNFKYIREIVDMYIPELKITGWHRIWDLINEKNVWIWGGGLNGRKLLALLQGISVKVEGIIDRDDSLTVVWGVPVFSVDKVDFQQIDFLIISMADKKIADDCVDVALSYGMSREDIALYRDHYVHILMDEQYFEDFIKYDEEETFVDAGGLDLKTSLQFVEQCRKNHVSNYKIYAFEPDNESYQRCKEIREKNSDLNINLFNYGLWSFSTVMGFYAKGDGGSRIVDNNFMNKVNVVSLDSIIKEKVTYIKMDIEGAEMEALKGCQNIIKKYKPKLAICVYHKKEDIIEIPRYIKNLVPEYHLYLRHYSDYVWETVLYALP